MVYITSEKLNEVNKVFKSVSMVNDSRAVPASNSKVTTSKAANQIIVSAQTEAEKILNSATAESSRLIDKARQEGYNAGKKEASLRYESLLNAMSAMLSEMECIKREMSENLKENIVSLGISIAARVLRHEIETDPMSLESMIRDIFDSIAPAKDVTLNLSLADFDVLKDLRPEFEVAAGHPDKFRISADPSLGRGDVIVHYECGTIDAKITTQLENIARALMISANEHEHAI